MWLMETEAMVLGVRFLLVPVLILQLVGRKALHYSTEGRGGGDGIPPASGE